MADFKKRGGFGGGKSFGRRDFGGSSDSRGGSSFGGGAGRSRFNRPGNRDFRQTQMFSATCAECAKPCEVPFRPNGDKPVFCSYCFNKNKPAGTDSRSLAAAGQAMSNYGKTIGGVSPLMQAKKTANMLDLAGGDFLTFQTLNRMSDTQLANMTDTQAAELGIDFGKVKTFQKNQVQGTWGSATNKASVDSILQKARASGKLDEGDKNKLYMATTGQNAYDVDPSVVDATLKKALDITGNSDIAVSYKGASGAKPTEEGVLSSIAANTTGTTAGKQVGATASGQNTLDVQAQKYFNDNMQNIMTVFKAQSEQVMKSVESGDISKSISGISTAADEIAGAMLRAADKIDGGSRFSSSVSQSSSKKPGE